VPSPRERLVVDGLSRGAENYKVTEGPPDSSETEKVTVRPGDVLLGKYRVERVLGVGGMGVVVLAHHIPLDERVALKFLHAATRKNRTAVERFLREARSAAKIKNEHVARIIDVGALEDGAPYMVMEYLEGRDLAAWLEHRGPMPIDRTVDFVIQALEALAEAHAQNIVHRDLKPANLFCVSRADGQPSIKVLDFGISKVITSPNAPSMTKTRDLLGSPYYMSPEQMQRAKDADARTDIWSLGVMLFELITGHPPFLGETVMEIAIKVATDPTPSMQNRGMEVPPLLEAVIAKCLEKDPRRRYGNVGELAVALLPFTTADGARSSVDRIVGVVRSGAASGKGLHALSDIPMRWGPDGLSGTIEPLGRTSSRSSPGTTFRSVLLGIVVSGVLIGVAAAVRHGIKGSDAALAAPPLESVALPSPVDAQPPAPVEAPALSDAALLPPATLPPATPSRATDAPRVRRPAPAPGCDPPFTIDDQGRKHFKHECYGKP
jgi:eukaryotic-like serine/threonine-protein kinase